MRHIWLLVLAVTVLWVVAGCHHRGDESSNSAWQERPDFEPVILHDGWVTPDTVYLRRHLDTIEQRPFTGMATWVSWPRQEHGRLWIKGSVDDPPNDRVYDLGRRILTGEKGRVERLPAQAIEGAISDLRAARSARLKHNFIRTFFIAASGLEADFWFDDKLWEVACENFADMARVAKQGGCRGLFIDNETHSPRKFWSYPALRTLDPVFYSAKSWQQTQSMVRQRGREVAAAINREFPDITLFFHDTYSIFSGYGLISAAQLRDHKHMGLYPAFLDGILEGSTDQTIMVDGNGNARQHTVDRFAGRRYRSSHLPLQCGFTQVPDLFKNKTRVGFGLYLAGRGSDWQPGDPRPRWNPAEPNKSPFTPADMQAFIRHGLQFSDGYLWFWNEYTCWWLDSAEAELPEGIAIADHIQWVPRVYWDAIEQGVREARDWPGHPALVR